MGRGGDVQVKHPPASDGTKTLDTVEHEVRKYTAAAGIGEHYDAHTVDFDGKTFVKVPSYFLPTGSTISFDLIWDGYESGTFMVLFDSELPRTYFAIEQTNRNLYWTTTAFSEVVVNGTPITNNTFTVAPNTEYHVTLTVDRGFPIETIGVRYSGEDQFFFGQIWGFETVDGETGEIRRYPILKHGKVAEGAPVGTLVENVAAENPREGWVVNYQNDGRAAIPEFPLADAMDISVTLRINSDDRQEFGDDTVGNRLRFLHDKAQSGFLLSVGNATVITFSEHLQVGKLYHVDMQLRKNAGQDKYSLVASLNGNERNYGNIIFNAASISAFNLGGYVNGNGRGWGGQIYDFHIQYQTCLT